MRSVIGMHRCCFFILGRRGRHPYNFDYIFNRKANLLLAHSIWINSKTR